jgi:hypothetical protein
MNASPFAMRSLLFVLAALLVLLTAGRAGEAIAQKVESGFKIVTFDKAMKDQLVRSLPLKLAFPADYEMLVLDPAINGTVWARRGDLDHIARTKKPPPGAGLFHGRLTASVGYDHARNAFICGPGCDEEDIKADIEKTGADSVKLQKHSVNGVPVLSLEMGTANMAGATRKKLYLAYIAVLIDTNVFLISYSPPLDSPDHGSAAWQDFIGTLTQTDTGLGPAVARFASPAEDFARAARSETFRPVADAFIAALVAGDAAASIKLVSPNLLKQAGLDTVQSNLRDQTLPFFAAFKELGRSVTIARTADDFGSEGFVFYLTMVPKAGDARDFAVYVVEENGAKVIANILLDHDAFKASAR